MSTPPFDPVRYKAEQRQRWDTAATGWGKWWQIIESRLQVVSDRLVELADLRPGQQILDVATGIGEPAITAARHVGPSGRVVATDFSSQMLTIARMRAEELGLDNIEFREMDAEALALPEKSFDAILSRLGLMLLPDLKSTLERMLRLLVPGGRLAVAVWGPPQRVPFASMPMRVAMRELQLPPPPPGTPGMFSLADTQQLAQLLTQAGFMQVQTEPITTILELPSAEDFIHFYQDISPSLTALLANLSVERRAEVWQAIMQAARQYNAPDGTWRTENELILAVGRR